MPRSPGRRQTVALGVVLGMTVSTAEFPKPTMFRNMRFPMTECTAERERELDELLRAPTDPNPRRFSNHLYRCERGETDQMREERLQSNSAGRPFRAHGFGPRVDPAECDALDRDNPEWLPDRRRYTWDPRVTGHGYRRREVLYGTARAQAAIWRNQHPENCSQAKFLNVRLPDKAGFEESLQVASAALGLALDLDRVLVWDPTWIRFQFAPFPHCPGEFTWNCWFEAITSCGTPTADQNVLSKSWQDLEVSIGRPYAPLVAHRYATQAIWEEAVGNGSIYTVHTGPVKLRRLLECSPIKNDHWFYWWRSQTVTFFFRPNAATRKGVVDLRKTLTTFKFSSMVGVEPGQPARELLPGTIGCYMPLEEEKAREHTKQTSREEFRRPAHRFSEYADAAVALANGGAVKVLNKLVAEASSPSTFQKISLSRSLLVTADSLAYLNELSAWVASPNGSKTLKWTGFRLKLNSERRGSKDDRLPLPALPIAPIGVGYNPSRTTPNHREVTVISLLLESDAVICSLASPLCRIVDALRMTVGGRAGSPLVDWSAGIRSGLLNCGFPKWELSPLAARDRKCYLGY